MNCNAAAGQTVFHVHLHLLGGRKFSWPPGWKMTGDFPRVFSTDSVQVKVWINEIRVWVAFYRLQESNQREKSANEIGC
jgi:diadenosine tetraphosphate (Ap4A) HIT family hydrolase